MSRFKDFGDGGDVNTEPITFKLLGEEFTARPAIQGRTLLNIVADADSDDTGKVATVIPTFFEKALLPESYARFQALTEDPDRIVTTEKLGEIIGWLVEEYASRPTQEPSRSSSGD
jgi:hypothetical protein